MTKSCYALILCTLVAIGLSPGRATAMDIKVTIENLQQTEGFFFTPFWLGFHDGSFDLYDEGSAATAGLELLAEDGDPSTLKTEFFSATNGDSTTRFDKVVTSPGGFDGPPVFDPGETQTVMLSIPDAGSNRYFTFASMIIPSNDGFVGNGDPTAYEVFDAGGNFTGPIVIELFGRDLRDAGTEENTAMGAAFSMLGGTATDEGGTVLAPHPGLSNFVGSMTAASTNIGSDVGADEAVARITIVPEPASGWTLLLGLSAMFVRRRRN